VAYLTVRNKGEEGHSFFKLDAEHERYVVGRSEDCDLTVDSERLSRQHFALVRDGLDWFVEDLDSANGTRLNAEKVTARLKLSERDIIKAGQFRGTFHDGDVPTKKRRKPAAEIDIDGNALGGTTPTRERGIDDPADAMPCPHCKAWFSIAHRIPGDQMDCPACGKSSTVPQLV
jgi:pSer/pThr/pTyr-binding forkhead associated (FHA) protein